MTMDGIGRQRKALGARVTMSVIATTAAICIFAAIVKPAWHRVIVVRELLEWDRLSPPDWISDSSIAPAWLLPAAAVLNGLNTDTIIVDDASVVDDDWARHLAYFGRLKVVDVRGSRLSDAAIQSLLARATIEELNIEGTATTSAAFETLRTGTNPLHGLYATSTQLTDSGVDAISYCRNLQTLHFGKCPVTAVAIESLRRCACLTTLYVHDTDIDDSAGPHLAVCHSLVELDLRGTKVTDAIVQYLIVLRGLKRLYLTGTLITAEGLSELSAARPDVNVVTD